MFIYVFKTSQSTYCLYKYYPLAKLMELAHFEAVHFDFFFLVINKLITDKMQNIFLLIVEHSGFMKYSLIPYFFLNVELFHIFLSIA